MKKNKFKKIITLKKKMKHGQMKMKMKMAGAKTTTTEMKNGLMMTMVVMGHWQ